MPALWAIFLELSRYRQVADARRDRIPPGRWLADFPGTWTLWRRMLILGITSYPYAVRMSAAANFARDLIRADPGWEKAPEMLRGQVTGWDLPASVRNAIREGLTSAYAPDPEALVSDWVTAALTRSDRHAMRLGTERRQIARDAAETLREASPEPGAGHAPAPAPGKPESTPQPASGATPQARPEARSEPALKLAASKSRNMTPGELEPHVAAMLEAYGDVSQAQVKRDLHVSTDKARDAIHLAKRNRTVVPMSASR
jgi:hypothetical protein